MDEDWQTDSKVVHLERDDFEHPRKRRNSTTMSGKHNFKCLTQSGMKQTRHRRQHSTHTEKACG